MSDTPVPAEPPEPSPWPDRTKGVLWILALHLLFTAATWSVGLTGVVGDDDARELLHTWVRWLWVLQGIYVLPAVLSAALLQKWQLMGGMIAATVLTALVGGLGAALI